MAENTESTDVKDFYSKDPNLLIKNQGNKIIVDYYLMDSIVDSSKYIQLLQILNDLTPNDEITIHISSPGGYVDTALQIVNAMKMCNGSVITVAEGLCASAATFIWLAGNNIYTTPYSRFLFHACSYGTWGKFNEVKEYGKFFESWFDETIRKIYKGFLTTEEITQMNEGKDFWFNADEAITRLKKSKDLESRVDELVDQLSIKYQEKIKTELDGIYDEDGNIIESRLNAIEKALIEQENTERNPKKSKK